MDDECLGTVPQVCENDSYSRAVDTKFLSHKANLGCSICIFSAERAKGSMGNISYYTMASSRTKDQIRFLLGNGHYWTYWEMAHT